MYAKTPGGMYADFGCMSMERLGAKYAVVGCKSMDTFHTCIDERIRIYVRCEDAEIDTSSPAGSTTDEELAGNPSSTNSDAGTNSEAP